MSASGAVSAAHQPRDPNRAAATDAHPELLLAAVEAGLPVFCEKPVAGSIADAVAVVPDGPGLPAGADVAALLLHGDA